MLSEELIQKAAQAVRGAKQIAILTGAGVSKESGVPTFRDAQEGLWAKFDPQQLTKTLQFSNFLATFLKILKENMRLLLCASGSEQPQKLWFYPTETCGGCCCCYELLLNSPAIFLELCPILCFCVVNLFWASGLKL